MRRVLVAASLVLSMSSAALAEDPIPLWPGKAPGVRAEIGPETRQTIDEGKPTELLSNVSSPTLTVFPADPAKANGAAVLIFPGGAYRVLAYDKEGTEVAAWLQSIGITAVVVKYRVPTAAEAVRHEMPLQDAQRAIGIVRSKAAEWNIKPDRIGVIGFSAGGHLAAALSTNFETRAYPEVDAADRLSCRPDFAILIYPAYLVTKEFTLSPELTISEKTPSTFLAMTEDDIVGVECALIYYRALKDAKVDAEMHLYAKGGHGYGLRPSKYEVVQWPKHAESWLRSLGVLDVTTPKTP